MRKFLISSERFTGSIELVFNAQEVLMSVSFANAGLTPGQIQYVMKLVPVHQSNLQSAFTETKAIITESSFEITFEMWFDKYDFKRNKKPSEKLWTPMKPEERVMAFYNTDSYLRYLKRVTWQNQMYPDTYLRQEHYRTEWDKLNK